MRAIIATVYNEEDNIERWWECLLRQTVLPDEIALVDGDSKDGTWEKLQQLEKQSPVPVKLARRRCNIAAGRNQAIQMTKADIIAATDAGSFPDEHWFAEITRPLLDDPAVDVVGGYTKTLFINEFQKFLESLEPAAPEPTRPEEVYPSSRNVAFLRQAWLDVGGYPEWLTLTGEDALFNFELHKVGKRFVYHPKAVVSWPVRDTAKAYFNMHYHYGFGAAEAGLFTKNYLRHWAVTLFPPLLFFSHHRFHHIGFRYRKNAAGAWGWLAGKLRGNSPPKTWQRIDGMLLSPDAQRKLSQFLVAKEKVNS